MRDLRPEADGDCDILLLVLIGDTEKTVREEGEIGFAAVVGCGLDAQLLNLLSSGDSGSDYSCS